MCLAVPGRVLTADAAGDGAPTALRMGRVDFGGVVKEVCLEYVPEAAVGDYVIVHVGFAIARLDEAEAERSLALWTQMTRDEVGPPKP
jgi:hydrogenase expression/formation protein HypC